MALGHDLRRSRAWTTLALTVNKSTSHNLESSLERQEGALEMKKTRFSEEQIIGA